jgi:hypothetical protein
MQACEIQCLKIAPPQLPNLTTENNQNRYGVFRFKPNPSAKLGLDRFTGVSCGTPVPCSIWLFSFLDRASDQTIEPILMVDGSNDVLSLGKKPFGCHVNMSLQLYAWLPRSSFSDLLKENMKWTKTDVKTKLIN